RRLLQAALEPSIRCGLGGVRSVLLCFSTGEASPAPTAAVGGWGAKDKVKLPGDDASERLSLLLSWRSSDSFSSIPSESLPEISATSGSPASVATTGLAISAPPPLPPVVAGLFMAAEKSRGHSQRQRK
ncbi:unnamed protein product, partial [Pylaiella littoralis]